MTITLKHTQRGSRLPREERLEITALLWNVEAAMKQLDQALDAAGLTEESSEVRQTKRFIGRAVRDSLRGKEL